MREYVSNLAPILLFVFNRPEHTQKTIQSLKKNELAPNSRLFIYSDAAKDKHHEINVEKVRSYIKNIDGLFSFLKTSKKSRKDIKNIKLNIIYDFLSNQIELKNIKINDNYVSSQFSNIAEGFIDINSNNLTRSRKLLNELIDLYEG